MRLNSGKVLSLNQTKHFLIFIFEMFRNIFEIKFSTKNIQHMILISFDWRVEIQQKFTSQDKVVWFQNVYGSIKKKYYRLCSPIDINTNEFQCQWITKIVWRSFISHINDSLIFGPAHTYNTSMSPVLSFNFFCLSFLLRQAKNNRFFHKR